MRAWLDRQARAGSSRRVRSTRYALGLAVAVTVLPASVGSAPPGAPTAVRASGRPVEMTAQGGLEVDLKKHIGIARKDVMIRRDDVLVCCDEAEARYRGDRIERVECRGRVVIVRPDGTRARADFAVFDAQADRITLTGSARVQAPEADLAGETIIYDIAGDRLDVRGKKSSFRFTPDAGPPLELERACPPVPAATP